MQKRVFIVMCFLLMMLAVIAGCSKSDDSSSSSTTYTISGTITGASNVTVTLGGDSSNSVVTSSTYSFTGLSAGNYTVTPTLAGYSFTPSSANVTISAANVTDEDFTAAAGSYAQTDLVASWNYTALKVASNGAGTWEYGTANIDSGGNISLTNCNDSSNTQTCPNATITWTLGENGVITEGGTDGNATLHMTLASNKAFAAGTSNTDSGKYELRIAMKRAAAYSATPLYNTSFVYHQLKLGANGDSTKWKYGEGNIGSDGTLNLTSQTKPDGTGANTEALSDSGGTISVNSSTGEVTLSGVSTFHGFLSYDGKTIVGTENDDEAAQLTIVQITGQTYTAGNVPDSTSYAHLLMAEASGHSTADGWARWTEVISSGADKQNDYVDSFGNTWTDIDRLTPAIDADGVVTKGNDGTVYNYNGQMSYDSSFIVGTATYVYSAEAYGYMLIIHTMKN